MPHKNSVIPKEYISPIYINGLNGRVLRIKSKKKREILLVYGHHSSLERIFGIAEVLADFGSVTAPDLPGFGGMDSLSSIDIKADFDSLADYLAAFIKTNYKDKKITLAAFSIGFAITTRMLQKYPDVASKVELLISVAGFSKRDDFKIPVFTQFLYRSLTKIFSGKYTAKIFRYTALNTLVLRVFYQYMPNAKHKFANQTKEEFTRHINFEIELWHNNDVRTYMTTAYAMLTADLTNAKVALPVHHVSIGDSDQYFNNDKVAKHFEMIYQSCSIEKANLSSHMPSVIASKEEAADLFPSSTRRLLSKRA